MFRYNVWTAWLTCMLIIVWSLSSCRPQSEPDTPGVSQDNPKDTVPVEQPVVRPIPICEGMPDSLAGFDWIRTTYRFGSTEKKRTLLHSFLQESLSRSQTSLLPLGRSGGVSLSFNPLCRGPLTTWSAMCDPMPMSAAPEALSALIPGGTTLIVETTYPFENQLVAEDVSYSSSELGFTFTSIGHDAFLYALRDTLAALVSRGSLPPVACIVAYPYKDNLLEE